MTLNYRVILREEPEGGYTAMVPSLPGCISFGETVEEAKKMVEEAIALYLESLRANGEPVPKEVDTLEYRVGVEADV